MEGHATAIATSSIHVAFELHMFSWFTVMAASWFMTVVACRESIHGANMVFVQRIRHKAIRSTATVGLGRPPVLGKRFVAVTLFFGALRILHTPEFSTLGTNLTGPRVGHELPVVWHDKVVHDRVKPTRRVGKH